MKIFLDAGHGGTNPGAVGSGGLREADVNLDIVLRTGRILSENGYTVLYSRTTDTTLSLTERSDMANSEGADYFVSVHCNSNADTSIGGTSTFYYKNGTVAESLALVVNDNLVRMIELRDIGIFTANFSVLRRTNMPAILVEVAFISNPAEEQLLALPTFRQNSAIGISNGIIQFTS